MVATLLKLDKEKIIQIDFTNNNIVFLLNKFDLLSEYEKYFLQTTIEKSNNNIISFNDIKNIITNECFCINIIELIKKSSKDMKYYETKTFTKNIITYMILINIIIFFVFKMHSNPDPFIIIIWFTTTFILAFLCYLANKKIYVRTKNGNLLYTKLNGLKNFLNDFSNINERKIEEIKLWDYYIIYAIIFDLKGQLDKDATSLYNKICLLKNNKLKCKII